MEAGGVTPADYVAIPVMNAVPIVTRNLKLVPHTPAHLLDLIQGADVYARSFGSAPAEGLREFFISKDVSPEWLERLKTSTTADVWTHGFGMVHNASGTVIGSAGFKGPPDTEGVVEIAYGVVPQHQGKGYATEAARALVEFAFATGQVKRVLAHTLPQPNASTNVLTKCGFRHVGEINDPEDGLVWRWERTQ